MLRESLGTIPGAIIIISKRVQAILLALCLKQALDAKPDNVVVLVYLGACYNSKAGNLQDPNGRKVVYQEAIKVLDKAKELDPEKAQANWGYTRYQAYYGYYGPTAAETKKAEAESK